MAAIIAGIGSRKTPPEILQKMEALGDLCRELGIWVRSGHAPGADYAFEKGARDHTVVYLPFPAFNKSSEILTPHVVSLPPERGKNWLKKPDPRAVMRAYDALRDYHPNKNLEGMARQYHLRNYFQVMGAGGHEDPVQAVVCWAEVDGYGMAKGGTGQAVRIANAKGIPIFNLSRHKAEEAATFLKELGQQ